MEEHKCCIVRKVWTTRGNEIYHIISNSSFLILIHAHLMGRAHDNTEVTKAPTDRMTAKIKWHIGCFKPAFWWCQQNTSCFPLWTFHCAPTLFFFFKWRIIALQNFVFCQTSTWISHGYTHIPSLLKLPTISLPTPCLYVDTEPLFEFPEPDRKFPLAIYFTYGNTSFCVTLPIYLTLPSPLPYP